MDSFSDKELYEEEERVLKEVAATLYIGNCFRVFILFHCSNARGLEAGTDSVGHVVKVLVRV